MFVLTFCYKREIPFHEDYYLNTHLPMLSKTAVVEMGAAKYEVRKVLTSMDGSASPYSYIFNLYFDSKEMFDRFITDPRVKEFQDDVANYYAGPPEGYVEEVISSFEGVNDR